MKARGTGNFLRPSDVRQYPIFYIELLYLFWTMVGITMAFANGVGDLSKPLPPETSAFWQVAASVGGITLLLTAALFVIGVGLYGLFWGGFKWRAYHMFGQFILRLYATIGTLSIYGFYPTQWISGALLCCIAALIYLKLKQTGRDYHA